MDPIYNDFDVEASLDFLVNSNLQDLTVSLQILYPSTKNGNSDDVCDDCSCCELISIDEFMKWINNNNKEISFHEDGGLSHQGQATSIENEPGVRNGEYLAKFMIGHSNNSNISPCAEEIEAIEFLRNNIEDLAEWLVDDKSNSPCTKDIGIGEDSSASVVSMESIEPIPIFSSGAKLKDDSTFIKVEDPLCIFNTATGDNLVYSACNNFNDNDAAKKIIQGNKEQRGQEETLFSETQQQNLSSSASSKINNQVFGNCDQAEENNNRSIMRKIIESKRRIEILRLQNTVLLNSDILIAKEQP